MQPRSKEGEIDRAHSIHLSEGNYTNDLMNLTKGVFVFYGKEANMICCEAVLKLTGIIISVYVF